jgi:SAM-dependent methyltransferase
MNFRGLEICCPICRHDLVRSGEELSCTECPRRYPIIAGIPDLRIFADPYIDIDADRKKGLGLAARLDEETLSSLIDYYYSTTSVVPPQHAAQYKRGLMAGVERAETALDFWVRTASAPAGGRLLEIGCGTGPLLVAAARRGYTLAGIDIAFRWLIVAKKRLMEAGMDIPLICACAEALPFPEESFDRVMIDSAIEVVADQSRALAEAHRVTAPEGWLFLSTPNRFSLGPDPHLGVPAGGYWPKAWLAAFARRQGAVPPKRNLLWAGSLSRLIRDGGFEPARIDVPRITAAQRRQFGTAIRMLIDLYSLAQRLPLARQFLFFIGPLLHAIAQKSRLAEQAH